jgi:hypothetical protein
MTPPNVNNSTIKDLNDSEAAKTSKNELKRAMIRMQRKITNISTLIKPSWIKIDS